VIPSRVALKGLTFVTILSPAGGGLKVWQSRRLNGDLYSDLLAYGS